MKKNCVNCNKEFNVKPSNFNKIKNCSRACSVEYAIKTNKYKGKNNPAYGAEVWDLQCEVCNMEFKRLARLQRRKTGVYCSKACSAIGGASKFDRSGDKNPNWGKGDKIKGDKNPNWKNGKTSIIKKLRGSTPYQKMRKKVFLRDNHTCVLCGSKENTELDHIIPVSVRMDLALDENNCRTLCKPCHQATDSYRRKA